MPKQPPCHRYLPAFLQEWLVERNLPDLDMHAEMMARLVTEGGGEGEGEDEE